MRERRYASLGRGGESKTDAVRRKYERCREIRRRGFAVAAFLDHLHDQLARAARTIFATRGEPMFTEYSDADQAPLRYYVPLCYGDFHDDLDVSSLGACLHSRAQ
jgi:hypothetical protein